MLSILHFEGYFYTFILMDARLHSEMRSLYFDRAVLHRIDVHLICTYTSAVEIVFLFLLPLLRCVPHVQIGHRRVGLVDDAFIVSFKFMCDCDH